MAGAPSDIALASLHYKRFGGLSLFGFLGIESWGQEPIDETVPQNMAESQILGFREQSEEIVKELRLIANYCEISTERARSRLDSAIDQGLFSITILFHILNSTCDASTDNAPLLIFQCHVFSLRHRHFCWPFSSVDHFSHIQEILTT